MELEQIIEKMKEIEPRYNLLEEDEINAQVKAIFDCDYEWVGSKFKNKVTGLYLNVNGLSKYSAEGIRDAYESTWSKQNFQDVEKKEQRQDLVKKQFRLVMFFLLCFVLYFFIDFKYVLIAQVLIGLLFLYGIKMMKEE
jgi:hypothetical protein